LVSPASLPPLQRVLLTLPNHQSQVSPATVAMGVTECQVVSTFPSCVTRGTGRRSHKPLASLALWHALSTPASPWTQVLMDLCLSFSCWTTPVPFDSKPHFSDACTSTQVKDNMLSVLLAPAWCCQTASPPRQKGALPRNEGPRHGPTCVKCHLAELGTPAGAQQL
jgi:hypothetical protein